MTLDGVPSIKNAFPFRVGTTSYIIPDDILPNVTALAPLVDDIELLIFETPDISNLPDADTLHALNTLAAEHDLTYTVHLPLDMGLGSGSEQARQHAVSSCRRVIEATSHLEPFAYILHLDADDGGTRGEAPAPDPPAWERRMTHSVRELLDTGISPQHVCVETLAYRFEYADRIIEEHDLGVCLDIGHLGLYGYDVRSHIDRYLARTRVLHVHGLEDGKDHRGLDQLDPALLDYTVDALTASGDEPRVFTMEVFSKETFEPSMHVMHSHRTYTR